VAAAALIGRLTDNIWLLPPASESVEWAWWAEYACKLPIYIGDLICGLVGPVARGWPARLMSTLTDKVGNPVITFLGWVEAMFSVGLAVSEKTETGWFWLWTQVLGLLSSMTAYVRDYPWYEHNPWAWKTKAAIDFAGDVGSGGAWLGAAKRNMDFAIVCTEAKPAGPVWKLPDARVGQPYSVTFVAGADDVPLFPPFGWAITSGEMPDLVLELVEGDNDAHSVRLTGSPAVGHGGRLFTFDVLVANSYDPNATADRTFQVFVNP
jgi:hypothetical protein